jgi:hypothetical protein
MSHWLQSFLPFHFITYHPSDLTLPNHHHPDHHPCQSIFKNVSTILDDISKVFLVGGHYLWVEGWWFRGTKI